MKRESIAPCIVFFFLPALLGYGILFWEYTQRAKSSEATSWPTAQGTMIACKVENHRRDKGWYYSPSVEYRYMVNGQEYTSHRIAFSTTGISSERKDVVIGYLRKNKYTEGSPVVVSYNPSDPRESVLKPGTTLPIGLLIGIMFASLGTIGVSVGVVSLVRSTHNQSSGGDAQ